MLAKVVSAGVSLLLTFLVLELGARAYLLHIADRATVLTYASIDQLSSRYPARYSPHPYLGYYPTPGYENGPNRHNSLGYRGEEIESPKPAGEFRIVCLGGSTTYTGKVRDDQRAYPAQLELALRTLGAPNARVINAGAAGWTTWESLINLQFRVLDLEPDLIIIYHGINDVHARMVWPHEFYRGDNSGRRAGAAALFMPSIIEHSTLLRILAIRAGRAASHARLSRTVARAPDSYLGGLFLEQKSAGLYPDGPFKETPAGDMIRANAPVYFQRNIENMIAIARSRGIQTLLASFAYSPLFAGEAPSLSVEYVAAYKEMNFLLEGVAADQEVSFFDFAAQFPTGRKYFADGRHVTEEGARLKGELFAAFLIEAGLVPRSDEHQPARLSARPSSAEDRE